MSLKQALIDEIEREAVSTGKMLERIPEDKFDWSPHARSMAMKALAVHIVGIAAYTDVIATTDYLDIGERRPPQPEINTTQDIVDAFESATQKSLDALHTLSEEALGEEWIMRFGERIILRASKATAMRTMAMNHMYHHRAQLGGYLRLLDIPVPGMYGPSKDERL